MALKFLLNGEAGTVTDANPSSPVTINSPLATISGAYGAYGSYGIALPTSTTALAFEVSGNKGNLLSAANGDFTLESYLTYETEAAVSDRTEPVIYFGDDASGFFVQLELQSGAPANTRRWAMRIGTGVYNEVHLTPVDVSMFGGWKHFAIVRYQGQYSFYMDGNRIVFEGGFDSSWFVADASTIVLKANTASMWIDELALYDVAKYTTATYTLPGEATFNTNAEMYANAEAVASLTADLTNTAPFWAYANLVSPTQTLTAIGSTRVGNAALTGLMGTVTADGHNAFGDNAAFITAPTQSLVAYGGLYASLTAPSPTLAITGTFVNYGDAALTAPSATLSATATAAAVGRATLRGPVGRAIGYSGAVISVTLTGSPTVTATGTVGIIGGAQITAPLFELTATGTRQNSGSALLEAPMGGTNLNRAVAYLMAPSATLTAIGHAVVAVTYEGYATNLNHTPKPGVAPIDEMTRYTNYPFDRIVRYKNSYFGMNSTGLYLLEGTADVATPIPWEFKTCMTDYGSVNLKTVNNVYFGGRLGPETTINEYVGEAGTEVYSFTTPRGDAVQNYRQSFGRGVKSRYYAFGASGSDVMSIDSISFDVVTLARNI